MPPSVSIIIPAYNCERFISETIDSVIHQTFKNFEVLIVDDGSTDGLRQIAGEFTLRDTRIKYRYQKNLGVSAARNFGFRQSHGNFIAFLDSDDIWLPENLELKLNRFERDNVGLVHSDASIINEHSEKKQATLRGAEGDLLDALLLWDGTQIPGPSSILIRREVLDTVGLFDENLSTAADKDLFIRIAARYKIGRVDQVTWKYRIHSNNMHKNIPVMEADVLFLYRKARTLNLFKTKAFEKKCFSVMYLILAATWAGDGKNLKKAFLFFLQAVRNDPQVIFNVMRRAVNRWILN
ncbi:MAG: glycosyltransferase family A protein [Cyclobacteriaceae bacterium]